MAKGTVDTNEAMKSLCVHACVRWAGRGSRGYFHCLHLAWEGKTGQCVGHITRSLMCKGVDLTLG